MAALNGELFGPHGCPHLDGGDRSGTQSAFCRNDKLLRAIHSLSTFDDEGDAPAGELRRSRCGGTRLGLREPARIPSGSFALDPLSFDLVWGSERKTTGSYYTPPDLVRELINSALVPRDGGAARSARRPERTARRRSSRCASSTQPPARAISCWRRRAGWGASWRKIRTGEEEPTPSAFRHAVRDVIRECIYAVDKNPLAVDLCKVALWIEGHNAGQPLSFLDHHVKCGDSLVGVFDLKVLEEGIPDDAYKAVEGDDKAAAKHYRKLNRETKKNRPTLPQFRSCRTMWSAAWRRCRIATSARPKMSPRKEREYAELVNRPAMQNLENACNAWTAAFFVPLRMPEFRGQRSGSDQRHGMGAPRRPADLRSAGRRDPKGADRIFFLPLAG